MRSGFLSALIALLASAALVQAQAPAAAVVEVVHDGPACVGSAESLWSAPPPPCQEPCPACCERVWFSTEYLLWWVRRGPLAAPVATIGSPADAVPGAIGQPGTLGLFGKGDLQFGAFSGLRLGGGFSVVDGWALEGNWFGLERHTAGRIRNSDDNGNPVIARPYFDNQLGAPAAYLDSFPGLLSGGVAISARTRFQGTELNLAAQVYHESSIGFEVLAGFRYLQLIEDLLIQDTVNPLAAGALTFLGAPVDPGSSLALYDRFRNYNNFYGGQLGGRVHWRRDALDLRLTGKLALGVTQQLALVDGATVLTAADGTTTGQGGGVLAQASNAGRFYRSTFSVVPEVALDVGWWLTPLIRLSVGYQFLYWSGVARPGSEVDGTVNPAQVPRDPRFGNGLGDNRPAFAFHQSDFWATGFNFSVLFQY